MKKILCALCLVFILGCENRVVEVYVNTPHIKRGWRSSSYKIIEHDTEDEYNGLYNGCWVRPMDIVARNRYGHGYIRVYGDGLYGKWANVQFKNAILGYDPFDLEKIEIDKIPLWALNRNGYYWDETEKE